MQSYVLASSLGAILGLSAHHGIFIHGEWHIRAPEIFVFHVLLLASLSTGAIWFHGVYLGVLFAAGLTTTVLYLTSLFTSILVYRVWFHPLTRGGFNGPWHMRTSKLWHVWACRTSRNHLLLDGIHMRYGDFVRTGKVLRISSVLRVLLTII